MKALLAIALSVAAVAGVTAGQTHPSLRFNWPSSMPEGLYWADYRAVKLRRGQAVLVCLPMVAAAWAERRGYIGHGDCDNGSEALLKQIAAVPGDRVTVTTNGIAVNGIAIRNSLALPHDEAGRVMDAVPPGIYLVPSGAVWLLAGHDARSLDSRYLGPLSADAVLGAVHPLLTF
jgi:conjugative transfer signal peptidase TraF